MSKRTDRELLGDIREAIRRITIYIAEMTYDVFLGDIKTQDAVIRNLETLGEATKNLSEQIRTEYASVPWKNMARVRDKLIHHYFGVNLDIVWQIMIVDLPQVAAQLEIIAIDDEKSND